MEKQWVKIWHKIYAFIVRKSYYTFGLDIFPGTQT